MLFSVVPACLRFINSDCGGSPLIRPSVAAIPPNAAKMPAAISSTAIGDYCRSFRVVYFYLDIRIDLLVYRCENFIHDGQLYLVHLLLLVPSEW